MDFSGGFLSQQNTDQIWREKPPNTATLLNVITLRRQHKSMRPTNNEASMKTKAPFTRRRLRVKRQHFIGSAFRLDGDSVLGS